jgi:hypothetical protein
LSGKPCLNEALSIGSAIETANKLNDLDSRLNQPVDTATDIAVTSVTESSKDAIFVSGNSPFSLT